jgi:hypothetical protein
LATFDFRRPRSSFKKNLNNIIIKIIFLSQRELCGSFRKTSQLKLFSRWKIAISTPNHKKTINALCGKNSEHFNQEAGNVYSCCCDLKAENQQVASESGAYGLEIILWIGMPRIFIFLLRYSR